MSKQYAKLKFLSIAAAGLITIVLMSLRSGGADPYPGAEPVNVSGDIAAAETPAERQNATDGKADDSPADQELSAKAAGDLDRWSPAIYALLGTKGFTVLNFELLKDGTYPMIHVAIPFELTIENEYRMTETIEKIAGLNSWRDLEMVDAAAGVRIQVICDRQYGMVDEVIINGDRNFFVRLAQKNAAESYIYTEPLAFKQEGKLLGLLKNAGWKRKGLEKGLGKSDSFFDGYAIYFERGINVKYSRDRVYNLVLNARYKETVLNGINFSAARDKVVETLGAPQFKDDSRELYGYKTTGYYIFLTGKDRLKEISIYFRDTKYSSDTLARLLDKYGSGEAGMDVYSFAADLREEWPDYDLSYDERGGMGVSYDSIGVSVNNWYEDRGGPFITVYSNFEGAIAPSLELPGKTEGLKDYSNDLLLLRLDADSIFEAEKRRLDRADHISGRRQEEGAVSPDGKTRVLKNDEGTYETAGLYLLSTDRSKPDVEIHTGYFTGKVLWLDSRYFIYEVIMSGIFIYDAENNKAGEFLLSEPDKNKDYELESYEEGLVTIRNNFDNSQVIKKIGFASDGTISVE